MPRPPQTPEEFWAKIQVGLADQCWPWLQYRDHADYGITYFGGMQRRAHQVAWELSNNKPWPYGLISRHSCNNPPCCNPGHVTPGTQKENAQDYVATGKYRNQNTSKTHCIHGHELSAVNVYTYNGKRDCRECNKIRKRKYRARRPKQTTTKGQHNELET